MFDWIDYYILALVTSVVITGIIIPKILFIAFRKNLFDEIDERKIHRGVVPRLGGIAFLPALIFSLSFAIGLNLEFGNRFLSEVSQVDLFFGICAVMLMYIVGIGDDLIGVRYRAKFVFQISAAIIILLSGLWIHNLYGLFFINSLPDWLGCLATIFFVVFVVNAINLIDGIDGLASGLSAISLVFFSIVFFKSNEYIYALLAAATLGTLVPFFYYNVFGNPNKRTKIFMGDTGSLTIGMILAFMTLKLFNTNPEKVELDNNIAIIAISPLLIPCFDVIRVFLHRIRMGRNPFMPDKCHIHHKLLALGLNQGKALITILVSDIVFILGNIYLSIIINPTLLIIIDVAAWWSCNVLMTRIIRLREKAHGIKLYE